ncbi:MAG: SDR family NAD(P)-dependent oxidoreductase [Bacteroidetes bacterium]|nr:SDR family NAD(P)-dependent oxidoreductase [Bacteroidota bacterium]
MKVLITGGAGFIGSTVTDRLLEEGHNVTVIDNFATGRRENISSHHNLRVIEGNISDMNLVSKTFRDFSPDAVLHAAASYKDPDNWNEDVSTNICGTVNITRVMAELKIKRLVYLQTSLCYGLHPLQNPISLGHPLFSGKSNGGSSYAISKTAGEQYIELSGLEFVSLRLANVYGPRNLSGPLPTFFRKISENKTCTVVDTRRDFIFISDVVDVIVKALEGKGKGYYHVSTGIDHSIKDLFDLAIKKLNMPEVKVEHKKMGPDDVKTILLDPSKTKTDFNWESKINLEAGVLLSVEWYKKNSLPVTYTHLKNIN